MLTGQQIISCVIDFPQCDRSYLSPVQVAWLHSLHRVGIAWLEIGEFFLRIRKKPLTFLTYAKRVFMLRFYFFRENSTIASGGVKTILFYHRKGISWLTEDVIPYLSAPRRTLLAKLSTQDKVAKVNTIRHCYHRYDLKSWKMACNWLMMRSSAEVWVIWPNGSSRRSASGYRQD